jgi:two-component system NtrC family response regulator
VIVVTGNHDRTNAVKAVSLGAYDFYEKPVDTDILRLLVNRAFHIYALEEQNRQLRESQDGSPLEGIIATDEGMLKVCRMVEKVAPTSASVLILGESGTGKELLARAVHAQSNRHAGRFVAINCAAIPEQLLESELFGYERGAFTGAAKQTIGKVELADGGTLFLDEIGDMPPPCRSCCDFCKTVSSNAWAGARRYTSTCASCAPPTRISARSSPPNASVRTCTTGSASSRSPYLHCGSGVPERS